MEPLIRKSEKIGRKRVKRHLVLVKIIKDPQKEREAKKKKQERKHCANHRKSYNHSFEEESH